MSDHLDTILTRYLAGDLEPAQVAAVGLHLSECADCRHEAAAFRTIDEALRRAEPMPASIAWIAAAGADYRRRLLRLAAGTVFLFLAQLLAGFGLLFWYHRSEPLFAGLVGGLLIGDSMLVLVLGLFLRDRGRSLAAQPGDWHEQVERWRRELSARIAACRSSRLALFLLATIGIVCLPVAWSQRGEAWILCSNAAMLLVGAVGSAVVWVQERNARRELRRLDTVAPGGEK